MLKEALHKVQNTAVNNTVTTVTLGRKSAHRPTTEKEKTVVI